MREVFFLSGPFSNCQTCDIWSGWCFMDTSQALDMQPILIFEQILLGMFLGLFAFCMCLDSRARLNSSWTPFFGTQRNQTFQQVDMMCHCHPPPPLPTVFRSCRAPYFGDAVCLFEIPYPLYGSVLQVRGEVFVDAFDTREQHCRHRALTIWHFIHVSQFAPSIAWSGLPLPFPGSPVWDCVKSSH